MYTGRQAEAEVGDEVSCTAAQGGLQLLGSIDPSTQPLKGLQLQAWGTAGFLVLVLILPVQLSASPDSCLC